MSQGKKRVLFVMHMPPPVHGASLIGKYIRSSELLNKNYDCRYVNMTTAKSLEDIGKGGIKKYLVFFKMLIKSYKAIKSFRPDAIYVTPNSACGPFYKDFFVVQLLKLWKKKSTQLIMHFHNKGVKTRQDFWKDNWMYRHFFRNTKLILLAEPLYEDVCKYVKREDVKICPNGIPELIDENVEVKHKTNRVPHILWLSNIMKTKGVMEYLDALQILKSRKLKFQADFVGGPTMEIGIEEFLSELTLHNLDDCTDYLGVKFGLGKSECYMNSDIFVLPSYTEAFPLTVLEAMSCKIPVVASNVGGVSLEIIDGETGLLIGGNKPIMRNDFRPSAVELADKLELLIKDKSIRDAMGEAAYKHYVKNFNLEAFERNFVDTMDSLLN